MICQYSPASLFAKSHGVSCEILYNFSYGEHSLESSYNGCSCYIDFNPSLTDSQIRYVFYLIFYLFTFSASCSGHLQTLNNAESEVSFFMHVNCNKVGSLLHHPGLLGCARIEYFNPFYVSTCFC